jgi:putative transposase
VVHAANVQDVRGAKPVVRTLRPKRRRPRLQVIWADAAYDRPPLLAWTRRTVGAGLAIVHKLADQVGFVPLPKRWIVERTFGWWGRYRRLSKDYEQSPASSAAWVYLAMIHVMVRRLA